MSSNEGMSRQPSIAKEPQEIHRFITRYHPEFSDFFKDLDSEDFPDSHYDDPVEELKKIYRRVDWNHDRYSRYYSFQSDIGEEYLERASQLVEHFHLVRELIERD